MGEGLLLVGGANEGAWSESLLPSGMNSVNNELRVEGRGWVYNFCFKSGDSERM